MKYKIKFNWILYFLFSILLFYIIKCILKRIKIKENLENKCNPIFTANGTEITISPYNYSTYLSIDQTSSMDNIYLNSIGTTWVLEKINKNYVKEYKSAKITDCSIYIKTKIDVIKQIPPFSDKIKSDLYYYITTQNDSNKITASLFDDSIDKWLIIDIFEYIDSDKNINNDLKKIILELKLKITQDNETKYVFIIKDNSFLTKGKININLIEKPFNSDSIWKLSIHNPTKKEQIFKKINTSTMYKPTTAIGEFPNKVNTEHGEFMSFFLPLWNRKWYTIKEGEIEEFSINLLTSEYIDNGQYKTKETYATGIVMLSDKTIYDVRTYGSDMIYGTINNSVNEKNKNEKIILKMVPYDTNFKETMFDGIPMLKGWIEKSDGSITSLCGTYDKNKVGVCISPQLPEASYPMYLRKEDKFPVDFDGKYIK
jgi:hypothetical protein